MDNRYWTYYGIVHLLILLKATAVTKDHSACNKERMCVRIRFRAYNSEIELCTENFVKYRMCIL